MKTINKTTKTQPTPAPWKIFMGNYGTYASINKDTSHRICTIQVGDGNLEPTEANANVNLIGKAPEMLDMLREFVLLERTNMTKKQVQLRIDLAKELIEKIETETIF